MTGNNVWVCKERGPKDEEPEQHSVSDGRKDLRNQHCCTHTFYILHVSGLSCVLTADALKCALASRQQACFCFRPDDRKRETYAWYLKMWWSQIKIRQLFSPAYIPHFTYLSFTSMYIPHFQISSSICHLISHWCLIPITFLSLSQLLIFHLLPLWQHLAVLPLCLHSILTSLPVLSSLTTPSLYIHSFAIASVVFLASHSTTQFLSVKASSSLLLIFFNLPNFKVWWPPIDHVKLTTPY